MTDETETPQPDEAADSSMEDDWAAAMAEQAVAEAAAAQPAQIFQDAACSCGPRLADHCC